MRRAIPFGLLLHSLAVLTPVSWLAAAAKPADSEWLRVTGPPALEFPRDHGAHPRFRTEWWYLTGLLRDARGDRYGFQVTFFRQGLDPSPAAPGDSKLRARQAVAAHLAVADIERGAFLHADRLRRATGGLAGFSERELRVWVDDWELERREDGALRVRARDPGGAGLALELRPERPLVRHGDAGYSQKGPDPGNASVYLSWTRLGVEGELLVDGEWTEVRGTAWFDHEWGTSQLGPGVVGWDWFSLRLEDGRDLMVYQLRRKDGSPDPLSSGTFVESDGAVARLAADDVEIETTARWTSPESGATYPAGWRIRIPRFALDLEVRPLLAAAELDGRASTGVVYWEGPVEVTGSHSGEGYVELTGYAGTLEDRF